ncbi:glycoside hydrolase family 13 protein [Halomarina litorea]|uniref:glycoside hydrolase family 13 protein n=1 Tax=Halomarina litorea TaxID=2961595 RepID=UPI0020C213D9|nr:alpha-glucosidase [Halomarina sp. BCD28]
MDWHDELSWWQTAVVYQIYPRSFNDSREDTESARRTDGEGSVRHPAGRPLPGDGVGDIPGIVERLDYLADLGVDVVWLSPVYDSPQVDNGYDVRDYRAIDESFGTLADIDHLVDELHARGMRLVMDLVVNHTSDQHEWFEASRRGEEPYDDYYIWREGHDGGPPNNWEAVFGGSAWSYDETRGEYYLSVFSSSQPDLNWANSRVRKEVHDVVRWWLDRGVDGFRMDVVNFISKTPGLPDGDPDGNVVGSEHFIDGPEVTAYLRELHDAVLSEYDAMTVGEMPGVSVEAARAYLEAGLDMVFHFDHVNVGVGKSGIWDVPEWELPELKSVIDEWQSGLEEYWNAPYLGNHDQPRAVSRFGDESFREESATALATLLLTLRGTPFVYQGDELGMTNYPFGTPEEFRDIETRQYVQEALSGGERTFEDIAPAVRFWSRDNARTPMQWTDGSNAGFTTGDPWLPVNPNHETVNAEAERADPESVWHYYRRAIALRKAHPGLAAGDFDHLIPDHPSVFAYRRDGGRYLVACNLSAEPATVDLPWTWEGADRLIGNYPADDEGGPTLALRPYEARVYGAGVD